MERGIIHYDHSIPFKRRQKLSGEPEFKEAAVHCSAVLEGSKDPAAHLSGNHTTAFVLAAADPPKYLLSPWGIPVFWVQIRIDSAFIHIRNLFWRYVFDLLLVCLYFLLVLLLIPSRLFFRVILCRRSALRIPLWLHPNSFAISDWYASGCSATYAFNFSGSIFR